MSVSTARSYVVRLAVVSALASAAWYFVVRPMRDELTTRKATLAATHAEIELGKGQILASDRAPAAAIEQLKSQADALTRLWSVAAETSGLYEQIDSLAHRYGVVVERMEPNRGGAKGIASKDAPDAPTFNELAYSIELVGPYEGVARFVRAIQYELGMTRIESLRISPVESQSGSTQVRASVKTTHFQALGGLAAFDSIGESTP